MDEIDPETTIHVVCPTQPLPCLLMCWQPYTETKMSSFWRNFHHWLHWKLSFWQLPVQPVMNISSKWRLFRFSVGAIIRQGIGHQSCNIPSPASELRVNVTWIGGMGCKGVLHHHWFYISTFNQISKMNMRISKRYQMKSILVIPWYFKGYVFEGLGSWYK